MEAECLASRFGSRDEEELQTGNIKKTDFSRKINRNKFGGKISWS